MADSARGVTFGSFRRASGSSPGSSIHPPVRSTAPGPADCSANASVISGRCRPPRPASRRRGRASRAAMPKAPVPGAERGPHRVGGEPGQERSRDGGSAGRAASTPAGSSPGHSEAGQRQRMARRAHEGARTVGRLLHVLDQGPHRALMAPSVDAERRSGLGEDGRATAASPPSRGWATAARVSAARVRPGPAEEWRGGRRGGRPSRRRDEARQRQRLGPAAPAEGGGALDASTLRSARVSVSAAARPFGPDPTTMAHLIACGER